MPSASDPQSVLAVDRALSGQPDFGDTAQIQRRSVARYRFALEVLALRLPRVGTALPLTRDRSGAVLRDPVVRMALENALRRLEDGEIRAPDPLEDVLGAARSGRLMPTQAECPAGPGYPGPDGPIWLLDLPDRPGPLQRRLRDAMTQQFLEHNDLHGELLPADARTVTQVSRAADLLGTLLPGVGRVLAHIAALGLMRASGVDGRQLSAAGGDLVPGVIVVEPGELDDPWQAAGTLLHEALHLRLFDVSRAFALVAEPLVTAPIPWRRARWDIRRLLFAFHVYAHVVLFQAAARAFGDQLEHRFGPAPAGVGVGRGLGDAYDTAAARAHYLGEQLLGPLRAQLTPDGRRLVHWLWGALVPLTGWSPVRVGAPSTPDDGPSPNGRYTQTPKLWVRPQPDLACQFVFNPADRTLHCLNLNAWAVFTLCDGRANLASSYRDLVASKLTAGAATRHLGLALARLAENGLIHRVPSPVTASPGRR